MDDFSVENDTNEFDLKPSPENFIEPGKQPASSMSPIIMVNKTSGNVTVIIGTAGGSKIPSVTTQVAILKLWLGKKVHEATSEPRIHHQLYPNYVNYELDFSKVCVFIQLPRFETSAVRLERII